VPKVTDYLQFQPVSFEPEDEGIAMAAAAILDYRRFPPPWSVEEQTLCFVVRDSKWQALAYFYYEQESARRSAAKPLSKDEARRVAAIFAKLPELSRKE
jgi:hypothetical protein